MNKNNNNKNYLACMLYQNKSVQSSMYEKTPMSKYSCLVTYISVAKVISYMEGWIATDGASTHSDPPHTGRLIICNHTLICK